jgi:hypothetical protein
MRTQWTEADVLALPTGEHDWFERKAGALYADGDGFSGALAKAASAFANTGGGSLVLGVDDDGVTFDGLPLARGATPMREWIEQRLPNLVSYPLVEFRVHDVVRDPTATTIPSGKTVVVIDVGDSPAAPHQCNYGAGKAQKYVYYMRQGGHSVPAPHFYVELVRQRLTAPVLTAELDGIRLRKAGAVEGTGAVFAHIEIVMRLANEGQIAAYKWQLQASHITGYPEGREEDYVWRRADFPVSDSKSSINLDPTILPGGHKLECIQLGLWLRPVGSGAGQLPRVLESLLNSTVLHYRLATEVGRTDERTVEFGEKLDAESLASEIEMQL